MAAASKGGADDMTQYLVASYATYALAALRFVK